MLEIRSYGQLLNLLAHRNKVVVVDFYASWCGPCQQVGPHYERMAQYYDPDKVVFCKCNVDSQPECARRFNARSIPYFVILVRGEVVGQVSGGDTALVQRHVDMALSLLTHEDAAAASNRTESEPATTATAATTTAPSTPASTVAMHMMRIEQALAEKDLIAEKEHADAVYTLLVTQASQAAASPPSPPASTSPMSDLLGMPLLPYLASEAYAASALDAVLRNISLRSHPDCVDGVLLLHQLLRALVEVLTCLTWNELSTWQRLHRAVLNLLRCPRTHATLISSPFFYRPDIRTGAELERCTLLGALWGIGPVPQDRRISSLAHRPAATADYMAYLILFPELEKEALAQRVYESQQTVELLSTANYEVVRQLLRSRSTRDTTLVFLAQALRLNTDYEKTVYRNSPLSSRYFMSQLQSVLIQAALPLVLDEHFAPSSIHAHYVLERVDAPSAARLVAQSAAAAAAAAAAGGAPNSHRCPEEAMSGNAASLSAAAREQTTLSSTGKGNVTTREGDASCTRLPGGMPALIDFGGREVERVAHYEANENPLPPSPGACYKPSVHLFFLAARAVTLCAAVFTEEHERDVRHLRQSGAMPAHTRHLLLAERSMYETLLQAPLLARQRLDFLNGWARWLLYVMGVDAESGALPASPPEAWRYLPQTVIDSVIRATRMAPIEEGGNMHGMIALMLVLMGNTRYFPKPHTHALFSSFLIQLMQDYHAKQMLERHPWFASHVMRGCIYGYIAVQKSTYERVHVRYDLSHCIKTFLESDALCEPVRVELEEKQSAVLERFSHMAVTEVNESVDQLIETLTTMNAMVRNGANLSEEGDAPNNNNNNNNTTQGRRQEDGANNNGRNTAPRRRAAAANHNESENEEEEQEEDENGGTVSYHQHGLSLRSHILLFSASMDMFLQLAVQFPRGVSQNMVAMQISQMLARSLVAFGGPESKNLKIEHSDRYEFRPREILSRLVRCLTHFRRSKSFLRALCQCGVPLSDVRAAMARVVQRELVTEDLTWKLTEMSEALETLSREVGAEEELWDDAPDFALDALLSTPLTHPVALPADVKSLDDLVYVNQDTIHHLLLSESKHPFTKEYLDEKMLREFNERPEVVAARERVMASIDNWLKEARRARLESVDEKPS